MVERVAEVSLEPPMLDPVRPVSNPMARFLESTVARLQPTVDRWSQLREGQLDAKIKEIETLNRQEIEKLAEAAKVHESVSFWGILEDIGSSMMGVVSIAVGATAVSAGSPIIGGALLVSGVVSIGNLAFRHMQVWDYIGDQVGGENETLKAAIKDYLPAAIGITAAAMGIYGSYAGWQYAAKTGIAGAVALLQGTTNVASSLVNYKSGISQSELRNISADLSFLQSNLSLSNLAVQVCAGDLEDFHKKQMGLHTNLGKLIEETDRTIQVTQQPV